MKYLFSQYLLFNEKMSIFKFETELSNPKKLKIINKLAFSGYVPKYCQNLPENLILKI